MENNWTIEQTKELFALAKTAYSQGKGLKVAFTQMSEKSSKSINSVRNYYYSQLKMFELVPSLAQNIGIETVREKRAAFRTFAPDEVRSLVKRILAAKGKGISVRACIASMTNTPKEALRLQNKFRSAVVRHKSLVEEIMNELNAEGSPYFNPYTKSTSSNCAVKGIDKLNEYISKLDEKEVNGFITLLSKLV